LPRCATGHRRQQIFKPGDRAVIAIPVARIDYRLHEIDARVPDKGMQRRADHRFAGNGPVLLGNVSPSAFTAPRRNDNGSYSLGHQTTLL